VGDPFLTTAATVTCPHGGQATIAPSQSAAVAGAAICTESDQVTIAGCPFTIGPNPSPCVTVQWQSSSQSTKLSGLAALTAGSVGLCLSAASAPQGPVVLAPAQFQAAAT
jgi:hypothetical protein